MMDVDDNGRDLQGEMLSGLDDMMDNWLDEVMMMGDDGLDLMGEMMMNGLDEMTDGRLMDDDGLDLLGEMLMNGLDDMTDN